VIATFPRERDTQPSAAILLGPGRMGSRKLEIQMDGYGVYQALDSFRSNLEYTSADGGTRKRGLVGRRQSQPRHTCVRVMCGTRVRVYRSLTKRLGWAGHRFARWVS
jgi:hypothetical protein